MRSSRSHKSSKVSRAILYENILSKLGWRGDGTKATTSLQAELDQCTVAEEKRAAKRRREDEATALVVADLRARLEASEERADSAEAKADALRKTQTRKRSDALQHSLARAEKRFREIQAAKETVTGPLYEMRK